MFTPEVLTILILNLIFALFSFIAFIISIKIFLKWDISSVSQSQYKLEKQSFLTATIIKYIFTIKVPLFLFFIFTLDKISNVLTGAMCGAGVVDATVYGTYLLILKIINLYLFAYWLILHNIDIKDEKQPYTKIKFGAFIIIFFFFISELVLEYMMFSTINIDKMVSCCGTLYSSSASSYMSNIFLLDNSLLLSLFYITYFFILFFYFFKNRYLFAITNLIFIVVSIVSLITFFGTYIYELPTHHCPFCFLQQEYYYVGYLIYTLLFGGTFYGLVIGLINTSQSIIEKNYFISVVLNSLYVILLSLYPIIFFIKNGVWL